MKKLMTITAFLAGLSAPIQAETIHVGVNGMVCAFCVAGIESSFKKESATDEVKVDLDTKLVTLKTKPSTTMEDAKIREIITDAGYEVTTIHRMDSDAKH